MLCYRCQTTSEFQFKEKECLIIYFFKSNMCLTRLLDVPSRSIAAAHPVRYIFVFSLHPKGNDVFRRVSRSEYGVKVRMRLASRVWVLYFHSPLPTFSVLFLPVQGRAGESVQAGLNALKLNLHDHLLPLVTHIFVYSRR